PEGASALRIRFHQLAGSGGSYGFPEISTVARELERWMAEGLAADPERLTAAIDRLEAAFRLAGEEMNVPAPARTGFSWVALTVMSATPLRDDVLGALRSAGYTVRIGSRYDDPPLVPVGAMPDLLIVSAEAGEGDPSAIASTWTSGAGRPRAVVLIETLRAVDRLRATAAGVDATFPAESAARLLPRYARTLARIGPPPRDLLLIESDLGRADLTALPLEEAGIRVARGNDAQPVLDLLDREVPDLLLLGMPLPATDVPTLIARIRAEQRYSRLPILVVGEGSESAHPREWEVADEVVPWPINADRLLHAVVASAERGRRLRETDIRDPITGLLNRGTVVSELEHEVEHRRRFGGSSAFLCFDLPSLDALGAAVEAGGRDRVLRHVATVVRSNVRASDLICRSDHEFGLVLRGGTPEGAAVVAEKLRRVIGLQPLVLPSGDAVPIPIRVGVATFPASGPKAAAVVQKAERQMRGEPSG
ncbi:MAG: diguanylate cyclase, partial [Gemmatimonadales bacterium]|nr:diguanylate cyclase [Gemmatimonadales bacterium]